MIIVPPGGTADRPGSTAVWWTWSPLRLQKPQLLSSGHGHLLSCPPQTQTTFDPVCCPSCPLVRHPEGRGGRRRSAMPGYRSQKWCRFLWGVNLTGLEVFKMCTIAVFRDFFRGPEIMFCLSCWTNQYLLWQVNIWFEMLISRSISWHLLWQVNHLLDILCAQDKKHFRTSGAS